MGTETTPVETPVETTPESPEQVEAFVNADGSFVEGWKNRLEEGLRNDKSLDSLKTVQSLAKSYVTTKTMVGKNKIAIPTEASTKDEWSEYYRAGGRPDTVEDYGLAVPEGFPAEVVEQIFPKDRIAKWQQRFYDGGVSKKAAQQFISEFANDVLEDLKNQQTNEEMQMEDLVGSLSKEWGNAYSQNIHLGNIAVDEGVLGDTDFKQRLTEKFGNDPDFIRYSSNLGKKFAEGKPPSFAAIPTPSDLQEEINKLESDPLYLKGTYSQRMAIANKIMAIRKRMTPEPATT